MARYKFEKDCIYCDGTRIGNIKGDCIYEGNSTYPGNGTRVGNIKGGCIFEGNSTYPGNGTRIGNVKNGYVYSGNSNYPGNGQKVCSVDDVTISGIEREKDEMIAAVYHFLIKKIL
jgi:hypothetical protein